MPDPTEWVLGLPIASDTTLTEWVLGMPVARDDDAAPAGDIVILRRRREEA